MWRIRFFTYLFIFFTPFFLFSQTSEDLSKIFSEAEKLHKEYKFDSAIDKYNIVIETSADSILTQVATQRVLQCENGISMLDFSTRPTVIAKKKVPLADFYLNFYDLGDKAWVLNPNPFVPLPHPYYQSIYKPAEILTVYYSAPDEKGVWSIFRSSIINDTLWSEPVMLSENVNSSGDDIFPMISPDGKELYFASNGHYGAGGYDLYVSRWESGINDWGVAENLGFPFSSPANDIFFANSPDGRYTILVSDRNTTRPNEVEIFILAYDSTPVRKMIGSAEEAQSVAKLDVQTRPRPADTAPAREARDTIFNGYTRVLTEIERLRTEQNATLQSIEDKRQRYLAATNADYRSTLERSIAEEELSSLEIRDKLEKKITEAQQMEMDFLAQGIVPKINQTRQEASEKSAENHIDYNYSFKNADFGYIGYITVLEPEPKIDYSFRVLDQAVILEDNTLPSGLIYQIQLMVTTTKAKVATLKGLAPVFETKTNTGKYVYTVGAFRTHAEASSHLNTVKKRGFSSAFIVAFNNGKSMSLTNAKALEQNRGSSASSGSANASATRTAASTNRSATSATSSASGKGTYQIIISGYSEAMPEPVLKAIKENTNKDIARMDMGGQNVYVIAPFASQKEAETLMDILQQLAVENVKIEQIQR